MGQTRALKQMLEAASGHLTKTAGLDDADTFSVLLNAFAAKVGSKIKVDALAEAGAHVTTP